MSSEPRVLDVRRDGDAVTLQLFVAEDVRFFQGHFPGCPILPGVTQLQWAVDLARRHVSFPPRFTHMANIKFMRVIAPNKTVELHLRFDERRGELQFEYRIDNTLCSSGGIGFAD